LSCQDFDMNTLKSQTKVREHLHVFPPPSWQYSFISLYDQVLCDRLDHLLLIISPSDLRA
jgi:hypothetical protein